jgi:hypothetical protein
VLAIPKTEIIATAGQNVTIECVFTGMPPPRTVWEYTETGGSPRELTNGANSRISLHHGFVQIINVQVEDAGQYACSSTDVRTVPYYARRE